MRRIAKGDRVHLHYTGTLTDGTVFDTSEGREPLALTVGAGDVIAGLDAALPGLAAGESHRIDLTAQDAYGPRLPERIKQIPLTEMPPDLAIHPGLELELQDPAGRVLPAVVVRVIDGEAYCDMNHPLAGQDLTFDIEVVDIV